MDIALRPVEDHELPDYSPPVIDPSIAAKDRHSPEYLSKLQERFGLDRSGRHPNAKSGDGKRHDLTDLSQRICDTVQTSNEFARKDAQSIGIADTIAVTGLLKIRDLFLSPDYKHQSPVDTLVTNHKRRILDQVLRDFGHEVAREPSAAQSR